MLENERLIEPVDPLRIGNLLDRRGVHLGNKVRIGGERGVTSVVSRLE